MGLTRETWYPIVEYPPGAFVDAQGWPPPPPDLVGDDVKKAQSRMNEVD
jgi:hypothetical protein